MGVDSEARPIDSKPRRQRQDRPSSSDRPRSAPAASSKTIRLRTSKDLELLFTPLCLAPVLEILEGLDKDVSFAVVRPAS